MIQIKCYRFILDHQTRKEIQFGTRPQDSYTRIEFYQSLDHVDSYPDETSLDEIRAIADKWRDDHYGFTKILYKQDNKYKKLVETNISKFYQDMIEGNVLVTEKV